MTYVPLTPGALVPGLTGDRYVTLLLQSLDAAYELYQVPLLNAHCSLEASSSSAVEVAQFVLPGNLDNRDILIIALWRGTTGQTAQLKFVVDDGVLDDEVNLSSTTSSYAVAQATLPLVNTVGPLRYGTIFLSCTGAALARIAHLFVAIPKAASYADGVLPSGAAKLAGWDLTATRGTWPTEVVQRMTANMRAIARDRRACLASGLHRFGGSGRPNYEHTGSAFKLVDRFLWPGGDPDRRLYRVAMRLSGDDPRARIQLGPYDFTADSGGWNFNLPTLHLPSGLQGFVWVRSNSGGTARLNTWQIFREPS
jgi:hypothetical protein